MELLARATSHSRTTSYVKYPLSEYGPAFVVRDLVVTVALNAGTGLLGYGCVGIQLAIFKRSLNTEALPQPA